MPRKLDHDQQVALVTAFLELRQTTRELVERANRAKDLARAERARALENRPDGTGRIGEGAGVSRSADVGRSIAADRTGHTGTTDSLERRRGGRRWSDPVQG